ncbi:putative eps15-like protein [Diplodia seriata]|uniref:Putative eps15-like protein n=1 Tax=Diplodia seriata TaxID=420778 RepID=A0A0G2GX97_9PEZI|nr:putative eps15-like protein [Diplodia seriata]
MPTLRKEPSASDSDLSDDPHGKHKKKRHLRPKHPNKHAEGARKRWRETITERERKRYEGVWAANRGVLLAPHLLHPAVTQHPNTTLEGLRDDVSALVVRDIWARARLPPHVLEEVWNLVDGRGVGRLRREEFVVGLWLIDQALKGRKLPVKVQESVWASVRGAGVKVRIR